MSYFLFLLVNAVLFLRPAEIFPEVRAVPFYEYLIIACLVFALPEVLRTLFGQSLDAQPVLLCTIGVLLGIVLSHVTNTNYSEAARTGIYFVKIVLYYILLISILNTPARLRGFLRWLVCFCIVLTTMTVLQFYGVIDLQALKPLKDTDFDRITGQEFSFVRLQGTGIFQDPNEFCLMQAVAIPLCLFLLTIPAPGQRWCQCHDCRASGRPILLTNSANSVSGVARLVWLAPLGLFLFAIALTHSRGGFLAFLAGLGALIWFRYGTQKAIALGMLGLPVILVAFAGRQTSFSSSFSSQAGTGQTRVQIWSDYFMEFRDAPVFGNGMELEDPTKKKEETHYVEEYKRAAHNSYLHAFAELGLFGGMLFVGAVFFAVLSVYRVHADTHILDQDQKRLLPFLFGSVIATAVGMMSLSLCFVIPTYLVLGLATAFARVTPVYPPLPALRLDGRRLGQMAALSVAFLGCMYLFIRVFIRWS